VLIIAVEVMKNFFKNVGLSIIVVLGCIVLGEIVVRIVATQQLVTPDPGIWYYDSQFGFSHLPNVDLMINHGEGLHHFITDRHGYRINCEDDLPDRESAPDLSILAIGDSYLESVSVENEETVPELLRGLFCEKYPLTVHATNAGVSSRDPCQYYLEAKRSLALQKYDLGLVFLYMGNDIISRIDTSSRPDPARQRRGSSLKFGSRRWVGVKIGKPVKHFLETNSHLFILFKNVVWAIAPRFGKSMGGLSKDWFVSNRSESRWAITADACQLIQNEFDRYNVPLYFVFISNVWQVREKMFYDYVKLIDVPSDSVEIDLPNKIMASVLNQRGLSALDPRNYMKEKVTNGSRLYGKIDRHLNAEGHRAIAEYIFPVADERLTPLIEEKLSTKLHEKSSATD
jgi:hypothetical protein